MKRFVRPGAFLLLAALLFCLSGCYSGNIDQYFSLPMASEEYRQLQSLIDEELASGSEYAAPIHGSYRQSVQLSDVDGDGADEALAFFRDAAKNPKINIYDSENGEHRLALPSPAKARPSGGSTMPISPATDRRRFSSHGRSPRVCPFWAYILSRAGPATCF